MSAAAERTEGYVIRALLNDDKISYETDFGGWTHDLQKARVLSLDGINARINGTNFFGKIVRVCRVVGEDQWGFASAEEAEHFGYSYESAGSERDVYRFAPVNNAEGSPVRYLRKRIPGESRWEVCDEER